MTYCVVTSRPGNDDGTACVQPGVHDGDHDGDACTGCAPTPAAPGRLTCNRHDDTVRTALQEFGDLYATLGESSTRNAPHGAGDPGDQPEAIPPIIAARMLIRATLVGWCKVLEEDLGITAPDEATIADDTRGAVLRRQWDVDIAVRGQRAAALPSERARLAKVAEAHRRAAAVLRDERAAGVDVIRALAGHVGDHRSKLLGEYVPVTCPQCRKADRTELAGFGGLLAGHICYRCGIHIGPVIDLAKGGRRPLNAAEHVDRGRIFAEDIIDVHQRAKSLIDPRRAPVTIACSCGARVAIDTDPDRYYTCPGCGDYGVLEWWRRREAPARTDEPMPLADLPDWLLRHHRLTVTLEQLRGWSRGERAAITPTSPGGHDPATGRRTPALYDPVAVLAVARRRAERKRSA